MRLRRRESLIYAVHEPQVISLAKAMNNFGERMMFGGTTAAEWERRCVASLAASRRRRGLSPFVNEEGFVKVDALATKAILEMKARLNA